MIEMMEVVSYLHNEVYMIHSDLHYENWLIVNGSLKLVDFGCAIIIGKDGFVDSKRPELY